MDAFFASNDDFSSQVGLIVCLCDDGCQCHILKFSSRESHHVAHSITDGELYAFIDAFNAGISIISDLCTAFGRNTTLQMFTDSKQVFDVIMRGRRPAKQHLAIDASAMRKVYERKKIDRAGLIRGTDNPADALTKIDDNNALEIILSTGLEETPVREWIVRTNNCIDKA